MLIEMSIKGLMVDPITNMPIVILKDKLGERVLSIWVGIFEANAIALSGHPSSSRTSTGASTGLWSATSRTTPSSPSFT